MRTLSFSRRLLFTGLVLTVVPLVLIGSTVGWLNRRMGREAQRGTETLAAADLDHVAHLVNTASAIYHDALREQTLMALRVFSDTVRRAGGVATLTRQVTWQATNQFDKTTTAVTLPAFAAGGVWLGQEAAPDARVPVVDEVSAVTGTRATVFQRMNARGDMLRVATNVLAGGRRALGTYVPAREPDGTTNPVVSAVLRRETYAGRAFVADGWYVTAYEPLISGGEVIGMLFVGLPEREAEARLMREMDGVKVGDTGRVFILQAKGENAGRVVRPVAGEAAGASLIDARDAGGRTWAREMVEGALALGDSRTASTSLRLRTDGGVQAYAVTYSYFEPWDWVIGVAVPEAELYRAAHEVQALSQSTARWLVAIGVLALIATALTWQLMARATQRRLRPMVERLNAAAGEIHGAAGSVAETSQHLAQGASSQAASSDSASAALAQVSAMTLLNATAAGEAATVAARGQRAADEGASAMDRMAAAMGSIETAGQKVSKIAHAIDELSFQTQLLSLNAAVEAARAGELGQGFAVVAEEVRSLSRRSADAAKDAGANVEQAIHCTRQGTALTSELRATLMGLVDLVRDLGAVIHHIAEDSSQQRAGVDRASEAVERLTSIGHDTAAAAEESAAAAQQLWAQSESLSNAARELVAFFDGARAAHDHPAAVDRGRQRSGPSRGARAVAAGRAA